MEENNQTNTNVPETTAATDTPDVSAETNVEQAADMNTTSVAPDVINAPETNVLANEASVEVVAGDISTPAPTDVTSEVVEASVIDTPDATVTDSKSVLAKTLLIQYGVAALVVVLMGTGLLYALEQQGRVHTGVFDKISALVLPAPSAAKVNGVKISMVDFEKNLKQLTTAAAQQGNDVTNESVIAQIRTQAIDVLVNTELLRQAAAEEGIEVTDEQVESRYQEIVKTIGGAEKLAEKMTELGITEESLRKDIQGEILIQTHLATAVDTATIAITDADLSAAYTQITAGAAGGQVPPLADIKDQLEAQLKLNKETELVNTYISSLRDGADIEVLI